MKKTICVSFPRSGHHLLVNFLFKYFSKDIDFKEIQGKETREKCYDVINAGKLNYCEFYNHCNSVPCTDSRTNFQKNHDFGLDLEIIEDFNYIIIYRNPIEAIISLYKYHSEDPFDNFFLGRKVYSSKEGWESFAKEMITYWKDFVKKWNLNKENSKFLFISYEELMDIPMISLLNVVKFLEPSSTPDIEFIGKIVNKMNITKKSNISRFIYYDKEFISRLEEEMFSEINSAGIK